MNSDCQLLVWHDWVEFDPVMVFDAGGRPSGPSKVVESYAPVLSQVRSQCPFCGSDPQNAYHYSIKPAMIGGIPDDEEFKCRRCGFVYLTQNWFTIEQGEESLAQFSILRKFDINSSKLGLAEVGTHLRRRFSDVQHLEPRRFEELVADVYQHLGYEVRLTQRTHDGGYDLVLLEASGRQQIIVECKRFADSRKVGIGTVRELLGATLLAGAHEARLVTSSSFTTVAARVPRQLAAVAGSVRLRLVDADALLRLLQVYNAELPPLEVVLKQGARSLMQEWEGG